MGKLKYKGYQVVLQEIPDEISLAFNICGCIHKCPDCHSKYLWSNDGQSLEDDIFNIVSKYNDYISCILFMGGDQDLDEIISIIKRIRNSYNNLAFAMYSGCDSLEDIKPILKYLDYIKIGRYDKELGGLNHKTTNQKMYSVKHCDDGTDELDNITYRFQNI